MLVTHQLQFAEQSDKILAMMDVRVVLVQVYGRPFIDICVWCVFTG